MSVIINGVYRYQTVAVEGKSRMYVTALDRQREILKAIEILIYEIAKE